MESSNSSNDCETKSRVEEAWKKMNAGMPIKMPKPVMNKLPSSSINKPKTNKSTPDWMVSLGMAPKKSTTNKNQEKVEKKIIESCDLQKQTGEDAKRLAAQALAAVRASSSTTTGGGKVEISEVRDFAGEEIQVKKMVDPNSKEAEDEKSKSTLTTPLDNILEQIKKKQKLSVLDKTKKDWGEYKEEKGVEDELDKYKKSANQYLDKVSFLQRADYREFERERDVRLASQSKRKVESREDD